MKKSIPISDDVHDFFTNPCPVLSGNNSKFILNEISNNHDYVIEYGMGASTLYFLQTAEKQPCTMISVEHNFNWFEICVQKIQEQTNLTKTFYNRKAWSLKEVSDFIKASDNHDAPQELRRLSNWQKSLSLGPFFRFSPNAQSRFSGKLGPLWCLVKPVFKLFASLYYSAFPSGRPQNGEWRGQKEKFELILRNIGPSIKDQFGESPNMEDYINAGLQDIKSKLKQNETVSALVIIDGGPRHKIVDTILDMEDKYSTFKPTIVLCDASRKFYEPVLNKRPSGKFMAGTNKTLKGATVTHDVSGPHADFWTGGNKTGEELAQKEIWIYHSTA